MKMFIIIAFTEVFNLKVQFLFVGIEFQKDIYLTALMASVVNSILDQSRATLDKSESVGDNRLRHIVAQILVKVVQQVDLDLVLVGGMSVRFKHILDALMQVKGFILLDKFSMHQRVPVLKLLNFERHKGATGFCGVKESESCLVVLVLFGCEFVQLVNHLLNGSGHLLLKSLLDPGLHF